MDILLELCFCDANMFYIIYNWVFMFNPEKETYNGKKENKFGTV